MNFCITYRPNDIHVFIEHTLGWAQQFEVVQYLTNNDIKNGFKKILGVQFVANNEPFPSLQQHKWKLGFMTYDFKNEIEQSLTPPKHNPKFNFPGQYFFTPDILFTFNNGEVQIQSNQKIDSTIIAQILNYKTPSTAFHSQFKNTATFEWYKQQFNNIREHIIKGDVYITNFCIEFESTATSINPVELYFKLNKQNPTPFSSFVKFKKQYLICASPERFIKKEQQTLISQPIKGTAARGKNNLEDEELIQQLKNSAKEQTENVMIVDLVRNDLSRICNDVRVSELFGIYSFESVHQMISTIKGELNNNVDFKEIIEATFPMGSMTGAPKMSAINICSDYENFNREIYSGTVGYITPDGDFDFNVVIRSIIYNEENGCSAIRVGSAITYNTTAEQEWNECLLKAKNLLNIFTS